MFEYLKCDICKGNCPNSRGSRKAYYSSTEYDGKFCGTGCVIKFILIQKKKKVKGKKVGNFDGNIKIVHLRC